MKSIKRGLCHAMATLLYGALPAAPAHADAAWETCAATGNDAQRLACYDRLARQPPAQPEGQEFALQQTPAEVRKVSPLSRHWELDDAAKQGAFLLRPHAPNYFLPLKYSNSPNNTPLQGSLLQSDLGLEQVEAKFQLSFKAKAVEGLFNADSDLWLGFTGTSYWQMYNSSISAAFRESNYEPEAMLVFRTNYDLAGLTGRFINLGLVHQSNGRPEALSRSWNRVYAQFGFERGNFALLIRPWYRIPENAAEDDNPDIEDYLGHGDLLATYKDGGSSYSLMLRNNLKSSSNRGAIQASWSFPLHGRLRGYVQYFNGYGESLIDYNYSQQSLGIGVSLTDWM
ncbi:MAG: phospholipase A [Pseudomonadota bacterium]|nr:phospholipase A [Pseudomonadota bacterium]